MVKKTSETKHSFTYLVTICERCDIFLISTQLSVVVVKVVFLRKRADLILVLLRANALTSLHLMQKKKNQDWKYVSFYGSSFVSSESNLILVLSVAGYLSCLDLLLVAQCTQCLRRQSMPDVPHQNHRNVIRLFP